MSSYLDIVKREDLVDIVNSEGFPKPLVGKVRRELKVTGKVSFQHVVFMNL